MSADVHDVARECSPFLDRLITRHPAWLERLQTNGRLLDDHPPGADDLAREIEKAGLEAGLRQFRNSEMMRIIWRELNRVASLEQTMADLSLLAELCLQAAIDAHAGELQSRFGAPRDKDGALLGLVVLGLGKLGGGELNLSSDIDIILCYPRAGHTDGTRSLANEEYFLRLARAVVKSLSEVTEDGFCFRADTRLRPFGDAGPLVCSFGAMEQYYQREGRDWERYALIKARAVAGDREAGGGLLERLKPFVYRRYIDFGAVEALQEMLASIREDAARKGREDDIKRGSGGIRDIEFLVQCLQLLRGGREPSLQTGSLMEALAQLEMLGILPASRIGGLREDYAFLRHLENTIQALHDQQTHEVPQGEDLHRVVRAMGFESPQALKDALARTRARVSGALEQCFPRLSEVAPSAPWRSTLEGMEELAGKPVDKFLARLDRVALSQRATARLDQFMPMLLGRIGAGGLSPPVQNDVLELVIAICKRSAYLALLVQNPAALGRMLELFSTSDWISRTVIHYPALLDELIDPALGRMLPDRDEIRTNTGRILTNHSDTESALAALNHSKRSFSLRLAVAELEGILTTREARLQLTELAEALISACAQLAARLMQERHGSLPGSELAVIGYGTLGARDMAYGSDLDLVFIHTPGAEESDGEKPLPAEQYLTRLVRRMLSMATTRSPAGRMYSIDTRLRPNGRAGLLVSSLAAFDRYQSESAWVWELQALVRARPVGGAESVAGQFEATRARVLATARDEELLRSEVAKMRSRMRREIAGGDPSKHGQGGLLDIDFVAQLGVLQCAHREPGLLRHTSSVEHLPILADLGWLSTSDAGILLNAREELTRARQRKTLSRNGVNCTPDMARSWEICRKFLA